MLLDTIPNGVNDFKFNWDFIDYNVNVYTLF